MAEGEDAGAANARRQRDQAAIRRITQLNVERRRKGPRIGQNWFYHEAEARMKSRLFFALGNEGRRRFADSFSHTDISNIPFREFHTGCETLFKVEREFTVERIKLYNTVFMLENDTFSSFYARLSAQVALCNWPNDQEKETLKDLFIGRIRDVEVQQQPIKAKADLDVTFKFALECEKGASTSAQFQKLLPHNQHSTGIKVKQEPICSIQSSRGKRNYPQIKLIDSRLKIIKQVNHATSVVIPIARSTENLVQLAMYYVISDGNEVILRIVVTRRNDVSTWCSKMRTWHVPLWNAIS